MVFHKMCTKHFAMNLTISIPNFSGDLRADYLLYTAYDFPEETPEEAAIIENWMYSPYQLSLQLYLIFLLDHHMI